MQSLLLTLPLMLCTPSSPAIEYIRYELYQLAASAQRVVSGTILSLQEGTFDLVVERDLLGGGPATLRLKRFRDWACAWRWSEYRVGQRVVLFLVGDRAMGAGDEGDWPRVEDGVLAPYRVQGLKPTTRSQEGVRLHGTLLSLEGLEAALTGYRACFRAVEESIKDRPVVYLEYALDPSAAEGYAGSSALARHLFEETLSSRSFRSGEKAVVAPALDVPPVIRAFADGFCPAPDPTVTWEPLWDSEFGAVSASLGDLNRDGWDDLAVKGDNRTLWILLPDPSGRMLAHTRIEPTTLGMEGQYSVEDLAAIGDLDADGVPDLAVGAPGREKAAGRVVALLLNREGGVKQALELAGKPLDDVTKDAPGFGATVACLGDLDGNGTPDILVDVDSMFAGIDFESLLSKNEPDPHLLLLLFLDSGGAVLRAVPVSSKDIHGQAADVTFADAMTGIGDLDGDGLSEVAIGFPFDDDGGEERGAVWIAFLARDGSVRARTKLSDWSGNLDARLLDGEHFGNAMAAPGDLDGDGIPDLIAAGEQELWILTLQRDGTVKSTHAAGRRSGGFVQAKIRSLAVLKGPQGALRLAVGGLQEGKKSGEAALWMLKLGPGPVLSAP